MKILIKEIEYNEFLYLEDINGEMRLNHIIIDNPKELLKIILDFNPIYNNTFYQTYLKYKK